MTNCKDNDMGSRTRRYGKPRQAELLLGRLASPGLNRGAAKSNARPVSATGLLVLLACACTLASEAQAALVRSGAGADGPAIQATVDQFRADLGPRREINWDAVPDNFAAPNFLPGDFFNSRGAFFSTPGTGVQVSADSSNPTSTPVRFGNINATYPGIFKTFSAERLFSPIGSAIVDLTFLVPGTTIPALVKGFGAVYADADLQDATSFEYFDAEGKSLGAFPIPAWNNGLSFLGVSFDSPVVRRVRIRYGNAALGPNDGNGTDVAVMDDFIYGEPLAAPSGRATHSSPIALSRNNRLLWSVNPADDSVSVFRTDTNLRLAKITVGDEPQSIALSADNTYAFVANAAGNSITVIRINDPLWGTFSAAVDTAWGQGGHITTGAEPYNIVISPDGLRLFVANSSQDTITVINTQTRAIIGHVDLRNSLANDPDRSRHFQPRGLAVTADSTKLYVTRLFSFTKPGGKQADDLGREGLVAVLDIDTASTSIADYAVARVVPLAPQVTGFKFPGLTNETAAFPNQLQSVVMHGDQAYLPNIAASPTGPLRFNLDTHAFVSVIDAVTGNAPVDAGTNKFLNLHLGARTPEAGKTKLFFANPWAIAFTTQSGVGTAYVVSAASDLLVKLNVDASGKLSFTASNTTTRYIDLNNPNQASTAGANAGKNPIGIAINSDGTRAYVANFVSHNVSVVDLDADAVIATMGSSPLPVPSSSGETNLVGAEMFFSSRGSFDSIPGFTNSLRNRLSSEGWQACASCHFKGLTDSIVWQFGVGPRKSVPLNSTWNPHNRDQQRVLNYSAIFDEVEDFELNIRNVSGPGPLALAVDGSIFNPNQGLLIADNGTNINLAPSVINAFGKANGNRPQVTVTLPGSPNPVPALTALRQWVRFAVRTPNAPLPGSWSSSAPSPSDIADGREHFLSAGCAQCHQGGNWTTSLKDFTSPPAGAEIFIERIPTPFAGNPIGAQYLNRFLRDVGSFNIGVDGAGNNLANNVGGIEVAAPSVTAGVQQPAPDALGRDYNADGKGIGFNVPSLQGIYNLPPFLHNGAAESIAAVIADVKHRTDNGRLPDMLGDPAKQAQLVKFVESIALNTVPFVKLIVTQTGGQIIVSFESVPGVSYALQGRDTLTTAWSSNLATVTAAGVRTDVALPNNAPTRFLRLVRAP